MSDREKVLVVVDDNEVRIHNSLGVDVVCIVDGESITLPDDWVGQLPHQVTHSMPIDVRFAELFDDEREPTDFKGHLEPGIRVEEEETTVSVGRPVPQESLFGQSFTTRQPASPGCSCGAMRGEKHKTSCSDQNPLVEGGDIVK